MPNFTRDVMDNLQQLHEGRCARLPIDYLDRESILTEVRFESFFGNGLPLELLPGTQAPPDLFADTEHSSRRMTLMHTMDRINRKYGQNAVGAGVAG